MGSDIVFCGSSLHLCLFFSCFFENYGTAFSILTYLFGEGDYNKNIPKFDGLIGSMFSISFSLFGYVYVLTRASFVFQSHNLIEVGKNLGLSSYESFLKLFYLLQDLQ